MAIALFPDEGFSSAVTASNLFKKNKVDNHKKAYSDVPLQHMSKYSLSRMQHIVQQHGRGEILARKVKAYSFLYLLDAKAVPFT